MQYPFGAEDTHVDNKLGKGHEHNYNGYINCIKMTLHNLKISICVMKSLTIRPRKK